MCQITVVNLHNDLFNAKMFLLLGTIGSQEHADGWGIAKAHQPIAKTGLPMYLTGNSGKVLRDEFSKAFPNEPLLGHIRKASPAIPVCDENSHPFVIDGVTFVHNGKLTPFEEKKFIMETSIEEADAKDPTKIVKKFIKRSDSLIFFEHFMSIFKKNTETDLKKKFVTVLKETMADFYGTFAFVFIIEDTYFLVRGKTKELSVIFLKDKKDKILGWVVNTSGKLLDYTTNLLGNLEQLEGKEISNFSLSTLLKEESIFVAGNTGLEVVGEIKENSAPVTTYNYGNWQQGVGNFTQGTAGKSGSGGTSKNPAVLYAEKIYKFMEDYSLTLMDISNLILGLYDMSTQEVEEYVLKHFCNIVIPIIKNGTNKNIRKRAEREHAYGISAISYLVNNTLEYPWILNTKPDQILFLDNCVKSKGDKK